MNKKKLNKLHISVLKPAETSCPIDIHCMSIIVCGIFFSFYNQLKSKLLAVVIDNMSQILSQIHSVLSTYKDSLFQKDFFCHLLIMLFQMYDLLSSNPYK